MIIRRPRKFQSSDLDVYFENQGSSQSNFNSIIKADLSLLSKNANVFGPSIREDVSGYE